MKIDKEKYPALFVAVAIQHPDPEVQQLNKEIIIVSRMNMHFISASVMDCVSRSYDKLKHFKDDLKEQIRGIAMKIDKTHHVFFYSILHQEDRIVIMGTVTWVVDGTYGQCLIGGHFIKGNPTNFFAYEHLDAEDGIIQDSVRIILGTELFLHYAELEIKELPPSRQIWDGPTCLYNNKTKVKINVVDCTWYTRLIQSGEFNVRGHFRMQPYLTGKRLIWINEFKKSGYTRKAKIESRISN